MIVTCNKLRSNVIKLSVTILLIKESVNFEMFKLQLLSFSKLWLEDNGDKTFMGGWCRGCWLKTYLWMVLLDGSSLWIYTNTKLAALKMQCCLCV